ncbi:Spherulation-specific family 4 [Legionella beliardensis]|uniref:Spherulation-specific family 4 n=1 Tax=Legionella beliardensis TaxID=91822 RepID=A0A378I361_9GAMM|nr:spherulation-specific family 4 protein [Legionella beliardensis]STX29116.1 Spherulation-specific family 4 [Legionella beliardensis]
MSLKKISILSLYFYSCASWCAPLAADVIINPKAAAGPSSFTFSYGVTAPQDYSRIYIDVEHRADTGFPQGGLMANYLIENQTLYKYVGPGWNWTPVKSVSVTGSTVKTWVIPRSDLLPTQACAGNLDYLYQVESAAGISSLVKMNLPFPSTPDCDGGGENDSQKIAVPSYFYPCTGSSNCYWDQLIKAAPTAGIALINPANGPGSSKSTAYAQQVTRSKNAGQAVLGYVYTSYAKRSLAAVKADIDKFYQWYAVDGIFFDEGFSSNCGQLSYYQNLNNYVKAKGGKGITIVNFGTGTPECYINSADILVTFESDYRAYVNWRPVGWETKYPASRFWHLVYGTAQSSLSNAISLTKQRHAGWVYVTPDVLPNPWDTLPSAAYWTDEINRVSQP